MPSTTSRDATNYPCVPVAAVCCSHQNRLLQLLGGEPAGLQAGELLQQHLHTSHSVCTIMQLISRQCQHTKSFELEHEHFM